MKNLRNKIERLKNLDVNHMNLVVAMMSEIADDMVKYYKDDTLEISWFKNGTPIRLNPRQLENNRDIFIKQTISLLNEKDKAGATSPTQYEEALSILKYKSGNEIVITGYNEDELIRAKGVLIIPEYIGNKRVASIREGAFDRCDCLKQVIILGNLNLGYASFANCANLESFIAPNITAISSGCIFSNCKSLEYVSLPNLKRIFCSGIFDGCKSLKKIELPNLIHLGTWDAFETAENLEEISLPRLITGGSLAIAVNKVGDFNRNLELELVVGTDMHSTAYKHLNPNKDSHTPSLKKLTIPHYLVNTSFDLTVLNFEVELI